MYELGFFKVSSEEEQASEGIFIEVARQTSNPYDPSSLGFGWFRIPVVVTFFHGGRQAWQLRKSVRACENTERFSAVGLAYGRETPEVGQS